MSYYSEQLSIFKSYFKENLPDVQSRMNIIGISDEGQIHCLNEWKVEYSQEDWDAMINLWNEFKKSSQS